MVRSNALVVMASPWVASLLVLLTLFGATTMQGCGGGEAAESAPQLCKTIVSSSSCLFLGCSTWRGHTNCSSLTHYCICKPGYCASQDGTCRPDPRLPPSCIVDAQETCFHDGLWGCGGDANDTKSCDFWGSQCTCTVGSCFDNATKKCVSGYPGGYNGTRHDKCKRTPGTCSFFPCRRDRGATECLGGLCFCSIPGEVWNGTEDGTTPDGTPPGMCVDSSPGNWTNITTECFEDRHLEGNTSRPGGAAVALEVYEPWPAKPLALKVEETLRRASSVIAAAFIVGLVAVGQRRQQQCLPSDSAEYVDLQGDES